jgi:purine-binding chemotaxis protein CheW
MQERHTRFLVCRVGHVLCALPLEHVEEVMRPMGVEPLTGAPSFVEGLAIVRGVPVPVINAASLLSGTATATTRFVTVKAGDRRVALAVDGVVGVVEIPPGSLDTLPPLFHGASLDAVSAIGTLDADLLLVLRSTCLIPDELWAVLEASCAVA